jgi:hypothetical protein
MKNVNKKPKPPPPSLPSRTAPNEVMVPISRPKAALKTITLVKQTLPDPLGKSKLFSLFRLAQRKGRRLRSDL